MRVGEKTSTSRGLGKLSPDHTTCPSSKTTHMSWYGVRSSLKRGPVLVNTGRGLVREAAAKSRESFSIDATVMRWLIDASASGKEARHTMGNGTDLGQQRQKPSF